MPPWHTLSLAHFTPTPRSPQEFSGVVEAAGPKSRLSVGERVCSLHWAQDLGWPAPFDSEAAMQSFIGLLCDGGYAEYAAGHHR